MMPCLGVSKKFLDMHNFQEAYIFDMNKDILDNCLYLKFKPIKDEIFYEFEKKLLSSGKTLDYYDLNEEECIFTIQVEKEFHQDLEVFLQGKYSKFSEKLKNRMCYPEQYLIRGVCDREEFARKAFSSYYGVEIPVNQEYCSIPVLKNEILNYKDE